MCSVLELGKDDNGTDEQGRDSSDSALLTVHQQPPAVEDYPPLFGLLKGTAKETGDIVAPLDEQWDADL